MLMKKNTRYNVRLAGKKGVEVTSLEISDEKMSKKIDEYYELLLSTQERAKAVSYTHLDVYKRQGFKDQVNLIREKINELY